MEDDFVVPMTPEVWELLGDLDELKIQILEGLQRRLGNRATLQEAISYLREEDLPPKKRHQRRPR